MARDGLGTVRSEEVSGEIAGPPGPSGAEQAAAPPTAEGIDADVAALEQADLAEGAGAAAGAADLCGAGTASAQVSAASSDGFAPRGAAALPPRDARTAGAVAERAMPVLADDRPGGTAWRARCLGSRCTGTQVRLTRALLAVILVCSLLAPGMVSASEPTTAAPRNGPVAVPGSTSGDNGSPPASLLPGIGATFKQVCLSSKQSGKPLLQWVPRPGKFLLGYCDFGQTSNRLMCLEGAIVMAALMNRTLIVEKQDMCMTDLEMRKSDEMKQYGGHIIDLPFAVDEVHLKACLNPPGVAAAGNHRMDELADGVPSLTGVEDGLPRLLPESIPEAISGRRVVTLDELLNATGLQALVVDKLRCQFPKHCIRKYKKCRAQGRLVFPEAEYGDWEYGGGKVDPARMTQLVESTHQVNVLLLGDSFPFPIIGYGMKPGMFDSSCSNLIQPVPQVLEDAADFIKSSLTLPYAALHLRRGDFQAYCQWRHCPFYSLRQVAYCMAQELHRSGLKVLFVATNARPYEEKTLRHLLDLKGIKMVTRPTNSSHFVRAALVEKVICAHAQQFFRQHASTFSGSIVNLRTNLGAPVCRDKFICQGYPEDFSVPPD